MEDDNSKNDFLARWANGTLSDEERKYFKKTNDFKLYKTILKGTDLLDVPVYNEEQLFEKIQKNKHEKAKVITLLPKWIYAVAASILVLVGSLYIFNQTTSYSTDFGEQLAIKLPDNSEVILNAKSTLSYKKDKWIDKRTLNLDGEAYFKVNKGSTFTVQTNQGGVAVLGTQFSVNSNTNILEVKCFEGKVKVSKGDVSKVIIAGEAVRIVNNSLEEWSFELSSSSWIQKESSFTNSPLKQVIKALKNQYNITINSNAINKELRFTGKFSHVDLKKALKTVFVPLKIKFTFIAKNNIVLGDR